MKIAVIGGGPSGMAAALAAKQQNPDTQVILIEKNEKLGKKLYITGKGRCNLTNDCSNDEFLQNVVTNPKFLYAAIKAFDAQKTMDFFQKNGCPLKTERGNRVFPQSEKSSDVTKCLATALTKANVGIWLNTNVQQISQDTDGEFTLTTNSQSYNFDKVIIATGGKFYSATGSTGDGYYFAKSLNHTIITPKPSLLGFVTKQKPNLAGLSLKNVTLSLVQNGKQLSSQFGEMLFTHQGISGPIALTLSTIATKTDFNNVCLVLDTKPALTIEQLDKRILKDFSLQKNKEFKNSLDLLLPSSLAQYVSQESKIDLQKEVNSVTQEERKRLCKLLKNLTFDVISLESPDTAIITSGGINVKEINPNTMESKLVKNLYFCGEVIDVDALTGGFNLQIAFCTGVKAGLSASREEQI